MEVDRKDFHDVDLFHFMKLFVYKFHLIYMFDKTIICPLLSTDTDSKIPNKRMELVRVIDFPDLQRSLKNLIGNQTEILFYVALGS